MESIEEDFEDLVYNFFLNNQGKAFTIGALRKRFEGVTIDPQIKQYSSNNLPRIIKKLQDTGKIKLIQHDMKTHYFLPEIFKSAQTEGEIQYFTPKIFISSEQGKKKVKKKFCKNCKKEIIAQHRFQKGHDSVLFPILASFTQKSINARANSGWFCPNCGERLNVYKRVQIIGYLSCWSVIAIMITVGFLEQGEPQIFFMVILMASIFSFFLISLMVRQLIRDILKKRNRKILERMKNIPRDSLK